MHLDTIKNLILSLRPHQWVKNLFVFAALIFSQELLNLDAFKKTFFAFVIFILAAGCVYLFNDLCDLKNDQNHPQKKNRPLALGKLKIVYAKLTAIILALVSLTAAYLLSSNFGGIIFIYLLLNIFYSLFLKKIPILDLLIVTSGFVLRAVAGAEVINVSISPWLLVCTFFLALYVVIGKRLTEAGNGLGNDLYPKDTLQKLFMLVFFGASLSYFFYTINPQTIAKFQTTNLFFTTPFVILGLLRYYFLATKKRALHSPSDAVLSDLPIILIILFWIISSIAVIYL